MNTEIPTYVTLLFPDGGSGVGKLNPHKKGWWVDVRRIRVSFADAHDLCDAWNARGEEKRP